MRIFGLTITRAKAAPANLSSIDSNRGWYPLIRESYAGAWQSNIEITLQTVLTHPVVFRCIGLIASDIAKMECRLVAEDSDGICTPTESASFTPFLRKPNRYQNRIQFFRSWVESKLIYGNTYILKERDNRGVVVAAYVLDAGRVTPLVAPDSSVYYRLRRDDLSTLNADDITVPASEIFHDRFNTLYHPLVGLSPIYACGVAATLGLNIQSSSALFFSNGARPSGVLTAPGEISNDTADRLKTQWESKFSGSNSGKIAVLGDGLKYEPMVMKFTDAQLTEQDKAVAEKICTAFGVPAYKVGAAPAPAYNNIEALNQQYYTDCLQAHIEDIELCLDEGLALPKAYYTQFDLDALLRMDTAALITSLVTAVGGKIMKPNEARARLNYGKVKGGDTVFAQQQDFSLESLLIRDQNDPFAKPEPAVPAAAPEPANDTDDADEAAAKFATALRLKFMEGALAHA